MIGVGWFREIGKKVSSARSAKWSDVQKEKLHLTPRCEVCDAKDNLQVHHKKPFHLWPELELVLANLCTLCGRCHLFIGHLGWWKSFNQNIEEDIKVWREKFRTRPKGPVGGNDSNSE